MLEYIIKTIKKLRSKKNPNFSFTVVKNSKHNMDIFLFKNNVKLAKFTATNYTTEEKIIQDFEKLIKLLRP